MLIIAIKFSNHAVKIALLEHVKCISKFKKITIITDNIETFEEFNSYVSFFHHENYLKTLKFINSHKEIFYFSVVHYIKILFFTLFTSHKMYSYLWLQGILPEESFMRNKSYIRKYILEKIELFVLNQVNVCIFVSDYMKYYYNHKYIFKSEHNIVIPCTSSLLFKNKPKIPNSFVTSEEFLFGRKYLKCSNYFMIFTTSIKTQSSLLFQILIYISNI